MRGYLAIIRTRFLTLIQYRAAAFAGLCTQIFWGLIYVMIFSAFYKQSSAVTPISLDQAIAFIWICQALLQLVPWNIDKQIQEQVRTGTVAYELIRPLDLYWLWFSRAFAIRTVPTLLRATPLFIIAGSFLGLSAPISWVAGVYFGLSCFFAVLLSSAITTLLMISLFWTISGEGILRLMPNIAILLSGLVVPLPLFPDWMQPFLNVQPFRGVLDIPCRLYTGVISPHDAIFYLAFQLVWTIAFIYLGKFFMNRCQRKLVVQGG